MYLAKSKNFPYLSALFFILFLSVYLLQLINPVFWMQAVENLAFSPYGFYQSFPSLLSFLTLLTYVFFHFNTYHLLSNLILFIAFGFLIETQLKKSLFLLFVFLATLLSILGQFFYEPFLKVYVVGVSAVVASFAGFCFSSFFLKKDRSSISFFISILLVLIWGFFQLNILSKATSWVGHLTGFLTGVLFYPFVKKDVC